MKEGRQGEGNVETAHPEKFQKSEHMVCCVIKSLSGYVEQYSTISGSRRLLRVTLSTIAIFNGQFPRRYFSQL